MNDYGYVEEFIYDYDFLEEFYEIKIFCCWTIANNLFSRNELPSITSINILNRIVNNKTNEN